MSAAGPLARLRIVVTRPRRPTDELGRLLAAEGAEVIHLPTVVIGEPPSYEPLDEALERAARGRCDWVLFASATAADVVVARMAARGLDPGALGRVAAVGPATARVLEGAGVPVVLTPETFTGEALADALGRGPGRVLLPRVAGGPPELPDALERAGWEVDEVPAYSNVPAARDAPEAERVRAGGFDVVTFTSASTARGFAHVVASPAELGLAPGERERTVACIGPRTADAARAAGFRVDLVAPEHTAQGLVAALVDHFAR